MKRITIAVMLLSSALLLMYCKPKADSPGQEMQSPVSDSMYQTLLIDTVTQCPLVSSLTLTGKISFNEEKVARIYPMVSGIISNANVQAGDYVNKGQSLGVIRSTEMAGYASDMTSAQASLSNSKKNLDAAESMYQSKLISQQDLVNAQTAYQQAQAQWKKASDVLQINGGNTESRYILKAPISGFVVEKQVNNDMSIRADNTNSLFTISDLKEVWVWANVYESNINSVHLGDEVKITTLAYPDKVYTGKIDKILDVLDPANKVMKIRVVLPNPGFLLKPEMFARIIVATKSNVQSLCVSSNALIFDHSQYYVLVSNGPTSIRIVPVQMISRYGNRTFISGNLHENDKVIASDALLIYEALNG
ncbi:MAG: efflux RND transporter periplasmic adaptor subunit [Bacteroidetes bacterium]|nr:efflux RND transporter periplasmic adaptor subunit [Bacteroidota bacterium]MBS1932191.1 efflux RND transporter periplasmic adaptor subunit [Bacteroidota bacterium]